MTRRRLALATTAALTVLACRGAAQRADTADPVSRMVDSLRGPVEHATGLRFKHPPRSAFRSRSQVRAYLVRKLDEELPPAKLAGIQTAYRLFGLMPDTLDLRAVLLDLYTEQVAGYYDPDSTMLFGVAGADPLQLRVVVAHELVHALQGQYMALDSILHQQDHNDRLTAAQAVLEGQATYASIRALVPGDQDPMANPQFWSLYRDQIREQQTAMPIFARAPLILRETLIFPYLAGAEFIRWWETSSFAKTVPFGPRMPVSTEQILYPDRYARGDRPVELAFDTVDAGGVLTEDQLGESEIRVLLARLAGTNEVRTVMPIGWGGDRYRVYRTPAGPALVWYAVWDDTTAARRFLEAATPGLGTTNRPGYRAAIERIDVAGRPATRYVLAPDAWTRWPHLAAVRVLEAAAP